MQRDGQDTGFLPRGPGFSPTAVRVGTVGTDWPQPLRTGRPWSWWKCEIWYRLGYTDNLRDLHVTGPSLNIRPLLNPSTNFLLVLNTNVHYRIHKIPALQALIIYFSHILIVLCFRTYFNIILPPVLSIRSGFLGRRFRTKVLHKFVVPHACYTSRRSHIFYWRVITVLGDKHKLWRFSL